MDEPSHARNAAYGATNIADRATAVLGNRYSYGDKFHISHNTFVLHDAPDTRTLVLKYLGQWQQSGTEIEEVTFKTTTEKDLRNKLRDVEEQLRRAQAEVADLQAAKEKHETKIHQLQDRLSYTEHALGVAKKESKLPEKNKQDESNNTGYILGNLGLEPNPPITTAEDVASSSRGGVSLASLQRLGATFGQVHPYRLESLYYLDRTS